MSEEHLTPADLVAEALARTPARLLTGRAGPGYRTGTWLGLRGDHAAARDAVYADLDLPRDFGADRVAAHQLFWADTRARSKSEYLLRPDLGRSFSDESRVRVAENCPAGADLQVVVGDGLSATAVARQAPELLDQLREEARRRGWVFGRPFAVRHCRVGILNGVGDLLSPVAVVLLIGERPGLATASSLSAYMAFRPHSGQTDADRNLISNIHDRGVTIREAAVRIAGYLEWFRRERRSGYSLKEKAITGELREMH